MDLVTPVTRDCCQDPCNISEGRSVQQNVNHPLPIPVDFITCFPLVIDKTQPKHSRPKFKICNSPSLM